MSPTDISEKGLERTIADSLVEEAGYLVGVPGHFDKEYALDFNNLLAFLKDSQPHIVEHFELESASSKKTKFLNRITGEISRRGIVDVLRRGVNDGPHFINLFYGTPSEGNAQAHKNFLLNRFIVTRQVHFSSSQPHLSVDLVIFINGLPLFTMELKNKLTKQTVEDAVEQYKNDRDPAEKIFEFGRCLAHFALDDSRLKFCTRLTKKDSWFLPFDRGCNDGAGNPHNPHGFRTDYFWKEILTKPRLVDILENYAQMVEGKNPKNGKRRAHLIFPRFHQLEVVRKLLADVSVRGCGKRYLIQHSAGSGKSNSIAWLSHQLVGLQREGKPIFDSVMVITDRRVLDQQIKNTIQGFSQVGSIVGHADSSGNLRHYIRAGKKIIITTVQKFPFILDEIGSDHKDSKFALIIDEAHSSQGGRTAAKMNMALSGNADEELDYEDEINRIIQNRKMLSNASYFAFTATPKNKTLEVFGEPYQEGQETKHKPFHNYSMKQAIQEGFILDVLSCFTPIQSYYQLIKRIEDDPEFDKIKAKKKMRKFVEAHPHAIRQKAQIMVDHFHTNVATKLKIGGEARAMVVTASIQKALEYYSAFNTYLSERKFPYKAIVAFSGEQEWMGQKVTEASMNQFPSGQIEEKIKQGPYRFLICADKFQTGYDEPLLHTMYVDKPLSGIKAVQTLSRLNRSHPKKYDTFVLDFVNPTDGIKESFDRYYRTTLLSGETDDNKLHNLKSDLDNKHVYSWDLVERVVSLFLAKAPRDKFEPDLEQCVGLFVEELEPDDQIGFKGKAKAFIRTYNFLGSILDYGLPAWEKLSIFLNLLVPKLPAPEEPDLSRGILEAIDMDTYRVEKSQDQKIFLNDENAEIDPAKVGGEGHPIEPNIERLSSILKAFNDNFGNIQWNDKDKISKIIAEEIPAKVSQDQAYQNAMANSDKQNARLEHDKAVNRVVAGMLHDHSELFKAFTSDQAFRSWVTDTSFVETYRLPLSGRPDLSSNGNQLS